MTLYTVNSRVAIVDSDGKPTAQVVQVFTQLTRLLGGSGFLPAFFFYKVPDGVPFGSLYLNSEGIIESTGEMADGQLLIGVAGANPVLGEIDGTTNQILVTLGPGTITLSTPQDIDTTATPTFAGLTLSDLDARGFMFVGSADDVSSTAAATNGQVLIGSTGSDPVAATITGTANRVTVTNGSGTITLSGPQDLATTSGPTFDNLTLANGFGCNGKTPQTEYTVSAAVAGTAGLVYTATEQGIINSLVTLVNQLRAALVANGIVV